MNPKEVIILVVLLILLVLVIKTIFFSGKENFNLQEIEHSRESCGNSLFNFPFENDECSSQEYIDSVGDIHLNYNRDAISSQTPFVIHMVNPNNPCCLRTCINDFTYTEENTQEGTNERNTLLGQYKDYIDHNLYYASRCNICLDNFSLALRRLNSDQVCDEVNPQNGDGDEESCRI